MLILSYLSKIVGSLRSLLANIKHIALFSKSYGKQNVRVKIFTIGSTLMFVLLGVLVVAFIAYLVVETPNPNDTIPNYLIPFIFLLPVSLIIGGLTIYLLPDVASKLNKVRNKNIAKDINLDKIFSQKRMKQSGLVALLTGLFILAVLISVLIYGV